MYDLLLRAAAAIAAFVILCACEPARCIRGLVETPRGGCLCPGGVEPIRGSDDAAVLDDAGFYVCPSDAGVGDSSVRDAGTLDGGGLDAGDAGPPVSVVVTDTSGTVGDMPVLIHDPDGRIRDVLATNSEGRATGLAPSGSMVTLVDESRRQLRTVTGVQAGEVIGFELQRDPTRIVCTTRAQLPGAFASAVGYSVCGVAGCMPVADPSVDVDVSLGVEGDVLVVATDASERAVAHSLLRGITEPSVTMPSWATDTVSLDVSVLGGAATAPVIVQVTSGHLPVFLGASGDTWAQRVSAVPTDGYVILSAAVVDGSLVQAHFQRVEAPLPAALTLDVTAAPSVSPLATDRTDPARPRVSFAADGADIDALIVTYRFDRLGGAGSVSWLVALPPDATEVQLPQLPPSLERFRPIEDAPRVSVEAYQDDDIATWSAARVRPVRLNHVSFSGRLGIRSASF